MSGTTPVVNSIVFDQQDYAKGQKITVTVNYTAGTSDDAQTFTGLATDSLTGLVGELTVGFTVINSDTTTVTVSDSGGRAWNPVSDSGSVAVFTSTA